MSLSFNEFQRELHKQGIEPKYAYMLTLLYERFGEVLSQQEEIAKIVVTFADTIEKVARMHQSDQQVLGELAKRAGLVGRTKGVDVQSVANEPE